MKRTPPLWKLADTTSGMRRMLKRGIPLNEYIDFAVKTGTYRAPGEPPENVEGRYRRGNRNYPAEYEILKMNEPLPTPARMPKSYWKQLEREERKKDNPYEDQREQLMQSYLNKSSSSSSTVTKDTTPLLHTDDYYRKLLGIPAPSKSSTMGMKSSTLNKAYVIACRQEELMRTSGKTAEESLEIVEALLKEAEKNQAEQSRHIQTNIQEWRQQQEQQQQKKKYGATAATTGTSSSSNITTPLPNSNDDDDDDDIDNKAVVPSILHSKPRTVRGIALWSQRLAAIPYHQWTVGASVALDHFIARSILELEDNVWNELLEGSNPSLAGMGRDIIMVRKALFPETNTDDNDKFSSTAEEKEIEDDHDDALEKSSSNKKKKKREKSIDELLASLGGFETDGEDANLWKDDDEDNDDYESHSNDDVIMKLRNELQNWRQRHWEDEPYHDWDTVLKDEFQTWLEGYVRIVLPEAASAGGVDYPETRQALLAVPPQDNSEDFWGNIRDETSAEAFLQGASATTTKNPQLDTFLNTLSTEEQVRRLVNMSTLRPMMDLDGIKPQTRLAFLERHADKLIQGVELEYIVEDGDGPITADQLVDWGYAVMAQKQQKGYNRNKHHKTKSAATERDDLLIVEPEQRFRLEKEPYDDSAIKKNYLIAWNIHKSSRARYEEYLYKTGELGLRYDDDGGGGGDTHKIKKQDGGFFEIK